MTRVYHLTRCPKCRLEAIEEIYTPSYCGHCSDPPDPESDVAIEYIGLYLPYEEDNDGR